jgi:hypothetical protein
LQCIERIELEVQHVGDTRLDAGDRRSAAANLPKLRQSAAAHAGDAEARCHRPANLWMSALRRLADGGCQTLDGSSQSLAWLHTIYSGRIVYICSRRSPRSPKRERRPQRLGHFIRWCLRRQSGAPTSRRRAAIDAPCQTSELSRQPTDPLYLAGGNTHVDTSGASCCQRLMRPAITAPRIGASQNSQSCAM